MSLEEAKQEQHEKNMEALGIKNHWCSPAERARLTESLYDIALMRLAGWEIKPSRESDNA